MSTIKAITITTQLNDENGIDYLILEMNLEHSLDAMQAVVGGNVEFCPTDNTLEIIVNESMLFDDSLMRNELAERVWELVDVHGCIPAGHEIHGPALIVGPTNSAGNSTDVPDGTFERIRAELVAEAFEGTVPRG